MAFAFGVPSTIRSNQLIAEIAEKKAKELEAPIYTQCDIDIKSNDVIQVTNTPEESGSPPSTLRMARGAVSWAEELGLEELWIAAAEPHLWRCERDLLYAVGEASSQIDVCVCEDIRKYPEDVWYCPESEQKRTRSAKDWWKREGKLKKMPMFVYKRVAK